MKETLMLNSTRDDMESTAYTSTWKDGMQTQSSTFLTQRVPPESDPTTPRTPRGLLTTRRMTTKEFNQNPDKRTMIAKEILASEASYLRLLETIKDVYFKPLKNALNSNRGMVSAHNLQIIFGDVLMLRDLSKTLTDDLRNRVAEWSPSQCLGDIFVKFCGTLKPYVNYMKNYAIILQTIERCLEQTPAFRAFLKRHDRQPNTKMLTLQELLLIPTRRINEMVTLLSTLVTYTPKDHADRLDLNKAIATLTELDTIIRETKQRLETEREMVALQKRILSCPTLLEANRFFLKQLDVAHLRPPTDAVSPELRAYQHIEMLGLYLFNDALVVTRRTSRHTPFGRSVQHIYRFETCCSLNRLRIEDIADSKYIKNGFRVFTPRRSWVCATDLYEDKYNWISLVEQTIRTVLDID